jgi:DNA-3-methyladenine glycosylase
MFGESGLIYIYAAYGMYPCLNIVTGPPGEPSAVLVRGVLFDGAAAPVLGPGRTSRALGVTLDDHGIRVDGPRLRVTNAREQLAIRATPRIGITRGIERTWRFIAAEYVQK